MTITVFLKALRERRGLSMDELAERIETTGSTISKLEKGQMNLTIEWMERLAKGLGVHPAELIDDRPSGGAEPLVADVAIYVGKSATDPLLALRRNGHELYQTLTDSLSALGIQPGHILLIAKTAIEREALEIGETVLVSLKQPSTADVLLIRQYLPPALLTTNSLVHNRRPLLAKESAVEICGIVAHTIL